MTATKEKFFKPEKINVRDKAQTTDSAARGIIEAEVIARDKKTEKLKALRLERDAAEGRTGEPAPKARRPAKKTATR